MYVLGSDKFEQDHFSSDMFLNSFTGTSTTLVITAFKIDIFRLKPEMDQSKLFQNLRQGLWTINYGEIIIKTYMSFILMFNSTGSFIV